MAAIHTQHPSRDQLTAFGHGRLNEADSKPIEEHLEACPECRTYLEQMPADSLVSLLQSSAADTYADASPGDSTADEKVEPVGPTADGSLPPLYKKVAQIITGPKLPAPAGQPQAPAAPGAGFSVPRQLETHARYQIVAPLGSGGMGTVYKAQHRLMERTVALKIVNPVLVNRPNAVERFTREVKAAAQLVHPNIVTAYDAEKVDDLLVLVMEYVEGQSLAEVLNSKRELPVAIACDYVRQTALGLQHALERGMVHRDIKPQNLMLQASPVASGPGVIKILDFGLARFVSEQGVAGGSTEQGSLMGSPDYMAPEQAQDAHSADARADIYSMGCTLYQLLAGQVPFPESSLLKKLEAHRDQQALPLHHLRADVPAELNAIVQKMMAKDPAQRYQTPAEVAAALAPFLTATPAITPAKPRAASKYRQPRFIAAIAACLLLVGGGIFLATYVLRVQTDKGTLIITSDDPDVQIEVKQGGKSVVLFFPKEKNRIELKEGEYTIEMVGGKQGLKLSTNKFKIENGKNQTVTVEYIPNHVAKVDSSKLPAELGFPFKAEEGQKKQKEWAAYLKRDVVEQNSLDMKLALIAPGEVPMTPDYQVKLTKPYFMGVHEVTVGQFRQFVKETAYRTDAERLGGGWLFDSKQKPEYVWSNRDFSPSDEHPVAFVSWNDAQRFCAWLTRKEKKNYRLPTNAEWEWASRAGANPDPKTLQSVGWFAANSAKKSQAVGKLPANTFGLFDMFGNVLEFCQDWYGPYPRGTATDPKGPASGELRVTRGGAFMHPPSEFLDGGAFQPTHAMLHSGFRVVCDLAPPPEKPADLDFPFSPEEGQKTQTQWAEFLKRDVVEKNSVGMKLALIPPGEFAMTAEYRVRLTKPYHMGVHEVTVGQFRQFVKETGYRTFAETSGGGRVDRNGELGEQNAEHIWSNRKFSPTDEHPVAFVCWNDAQRFCAWLSLKEKKHYRLATEAEWEWARRAGTNADDQTRASQGWYKHNSGNKSQPVGKLAANAFGLHDMFGNIAEFCHDWWYADLKLPAPTGTAIDPRGPEDPRVITDEMRRVVRGSAFIGTPSTDLGVFHPNLAMDHSGFRVVCEVDTDSEPKSSESIPSVDELLKTRQVLTVAQDGSGQFKTIREALDKVQQGQVILIKGKGPYRETPRKELPADVALVSLDGAHIEVDQWEVRPGATKPNWWHNGASFKTQGALRMSGLNWVGLPAPEDAIGLLVDLDPGGDMVVDKCTFLYPNAGIGLHYSSTVGDTGKILLQENYIMGFELHHKGGHVVVQRNWFRKSNGPLAFDLHKGGTIVFRENLVQNEWPISINVQPIDPANPLPGTNVRITNNVIEAADHAIVALPWGKAPFHLPCSVQIANNIIWSKRGNGIGVSSELINQVKDRWSIGPNAYQVEPKSKEPDTTWPLKKDDLVQTNLFISVDPASADYLRTAADGDLATKGAGGDLPVYFGALPPGPAPKDGDWFIRLRSLERSRAATPNFTELLARARTALRANQLDEVQRFADEVVKADPLQAEAWFLRAECHARRFRLKESIPDYDAAIRLKPDYTQALANRSFAFLNTLRLDECISDCNNVLRSKPNDHFAGIAYANRGGAWAWKGCFAKALSDFEFALQKDPTQALWIYWRGMLHRRMGNLEKGEVDRVEALKRHPDLAKQAFDRLDDIVPQPLPLDVWLEGREIVTVSKDGKGKYQTIGEAINVLKPGQVIKILDKGPYRERLDRDLPENVGIISEVGTRIEWNDWHKLNPRPENPKKFTFVGMSLRCPRNLRLDGLEIAAGNPDPNSGFTVVTNITADGDLVVESCRMSLAGNAVGRFDFNSWSKHNGNLWVRECDFNRHLFPLSAGSSVIVERSRLQDPSLELIHLYPRTPPREFVLRHNVAKGVHGVLFGALPNEATPADWKTTSVQIANNFIECESHPIWFQLGDDPNKRVYPRSVRIHNNILQSKEQRGVNLAASGLTEVKDHWQVSHNCYAKEPAGIGGLAVFPRHATADLIDAKPFLSVDAKNADYLRIPANGPLATGGIGGNLPAYIGPFPPGPAPKEGDWFTRLMAK